MRKLILLSLDALFDRDLSLLGPDAFLTNWLRHAAVCTQVKTVFPALTYPAHTTLMTGCDPVDHGIGQNMPFQPDVADDLRVWYLDAANIRRETLFTAVRKAGGTCASMLWPVTCRCPDIRWNFPEAHTVRGENQVMKMLQCGSAPWILQMELLHGRKRPSIAEPHLSDYAATLVQDVMKAHRPTLTAAHLIDLDDHRHRFGTDSAEARAAISRLNDRVEQIWHAMQHTSGYEDGLLALVSDHGQADVNRTVCLTELLESNNLGGSVTVQSNGMSAYLYPKGGNVTEAINWLMSHATMAGISRVYRREELDDMHAVKGPLYAVEAAAGVVFSDMLPEAKREKATHGFGPGHPAENCLFAVRGRGIREGAILPAMPMRDVAPTLAELMGTPLPQATGRSHAAEILA